MTTDNHSLRIAYSLGQSYKSRWVRLEQIMPSEADKYANVADLYNMFLSAATGKSAQALRPDGCPVEFDGDKIIAYLGFYIWPSDPNIAFSLTTTLGTIGSRRVVKASRSFSAMINNTNRYALPYYMTTVTISFETPVFNEFQQQLDLPPTWQIVDGIWLVFSEPIFAAVRIVGTAHGAAVVLELTFTKGLSEEQTVIGDYEEWFRGPNGEIIINSMPSTKVTSEIISNVDVAISVSFITESGGDSLNPGDVDSTSLTIEQHSVELPECLKSVLSFCPDAFDPFGLLTTFCDTRASKDVFFNGCNGKILGEREKEGGRSYCQKLETISEVSPWLPVEGK